MSAATETPDDVGTSRGRGVALDVVGLLARLTLGGVLIAAGLLKVGNPTGAARAVQGYRILPYDLAAYIGYGLPILEIIVGTLLVLGLFTRFAALVGGLLMIAFITGISQAWARGLHIDCGCFGGGGEVAANATRYPQEIARDVGLALCAGWLVWRPQTFAALDRVLFGR